MKTKPKILIGVPTLSYMHSLLVATIYTWIAESYKTGAYDLQFYPSIGVQPVQNARTEIVNKFLKGDCTHLFFIDSDTIPPLNALTKLLAADKDIVSGITPVIQHDPKRVATSDCNGFYKQWNIVTYADEHLREPYVGLIKIKAAGGSCLLIKRTALDKIKPPYFRFIDIDENGKKVDISEDIFFSLRALGSEVELWADTSIICGHHKNIIW